MVNRLPMPGDEAWDDFRRRFVDDQRRFRAFVPEARRWRRLAAAVAAVYERWPDPARRPPLFAVPIGVKDVFHVGGLPTRAGSRLPPELLAGDEAEAVRRLRAAGAVVLGKTVTTQFAWFEPGRTRNPRAPGHTPGGSSSGSAAAVAAGTCPLALGTQTIGSICRPAGFCGVVGFKPSQGRVPRTGSVPLSRSLDQVGLLAASVEWVERTAAVLLENWAPDPPSRRLPTIGLPIGPYLDTAEPAIRHRMRALQRRLAGAGWPMRDIPVMTDFATITNRHRRLLAAEALAAHAGWFAAHPEAYGPSMRALFDDGRSVKPGDVEAARAARPKLRRELQAALASAGADLFLSPSAVGPPPAGLATTGDPAMNLPWTQAGLPTVALPAGTTAEGLPLGVQLTGLLGRDEAVLRWAGQLEPVLAAADD